MMASASWLTLQLNITHANNNYLHKIRNILKQTMLINAQCSANSSSLQAIAIAQGLEIGFVRFVASAWQQKNLRKKGTKNGAEDGRSIKNHIAK